MKERSLWYKLDENNNPVPCDIKESYEYSEVMRKKRVRYTHIKKYDVKISTVFLPFDRNYSGYGKPIVFETMIFWKAEKELDQYQDRYCTWDEAIKGHREIVKMVIKKLRNKENEKKD